MDSIFVTGSSGFIGSKIIEKLSKSKVLTDSDNSKRIDLQNIKAPNHDIVLAKIFILHDGKPVYLNPEKRKYFVFKKEMVT